MRLLLILALAGGLYGAHQWWQDQKNEEAIAAETAGFVPVEMPDGASPHAVLVLAPAHCPSEQAQRTEALVGELKRKGIPVVRGDSFAFDVANPTDEQIAGMERAVRVFKSGAPAVFVKGMAMSNPTAAQTVAAYRGK